MKPIIIKDKDLDTYLAVLAGGRGKQALAMVMRLATLGFKMTDERGTDITPENVPTPEEIKP